MKKIIFITLIFISLSGLSQQLLRGYNVNARYGLLSDKGHITMHYNGMTFDSIRAPKLTSANITAAFPFEWGFKRHRFKIDPQIDIAMVNGKTDISQTIIDSLNANGGFGKDISINATFISVGAGIEYKLQFYIGRLHSFVGAGVDFRYVIANDMNLKTQKNELPTADANDYFAYIDDKTADGNKTNDDTYMFTATDGSIYKTLHDLKFYYCPKVELGFYPTRFLEIALVAQWSPLLNGKRNDAKITGYAGLSVVYFVPFGKEDKNRLLQYYKN